MAKISLAAASFHGFRFSCGPKRGDGGPVVVAEFHAQWSEKNREAGGWKEIPDTVSGNVSLVPDELAATHFEFKPRGFAGFSLDCSTASGFHVFVPTKEGEERELRFTIKTSALHAGKELDRFGRVAGTAPGTLRISHDEDAQQTLDDADNQRELAEAAGE